MKRSMAVIIGVVLVAAAIAGILVVGINSKDNKSSKKTTAIVTSKKESRPDTKAACAIFTLADAKQVLGDTAKGGDNGNSTSSDDLAVSTCNYTQDLSSGNVPISASKSASLLVRAPKTDAGKASNQNQFGPLKPTDAQDTTGYGDKAYWDPQYGQLNILKNGAWYILSNGPTIPASRTADEAKQLADLLIAKM